MTESAIGTTLLGDQLNVFGGGRAPPVIGANTPVYVNVRKCRGSDEFEYETWVPPRMANQGTEKWVPLAGALNRFNGRPIWLVGPKLPTDTNLLAYASSAKPEIRVVRLYFAEPQRTAIESGKFGGIQLTGYEAKWISIKKGEMVNLPNGKAVPVSVDLLGLEATITLSNKQRNSAPDSYPDDFYVATAGSELVTKPLSCDACKDLRVGETRTVKLLPQMLPPAAYSERPPAFLVNTRTGLRVPIPEMPK